MNQQAQLKYFFIYFSCDWHQTYKYEFPHALERMFTLQLIPSPTILCTFHYALPDVGRFENSSVFEFAV